MRIQHHSIKYQWKCEVDTCQKSKKWTSEYGQDNFGEASIHCQTDGHIVEVRQTKEMTLHP